MNKDSEILLSTEHTYVPDIVKEVHDVVSRYGKEKIFIAGGCFISYLRDGTINDIDVFCPNYLKVVPQMLDNPAFELKENHHSYVNFSYKGYVVQVVKKKYKSMKDLFNEIDLTISCAGYTGGVFYCLDTWLEDYNDRRLIVNFPITNYYTLMKRIIKFSKRGYSISDDDLLCTIKKIHDSDYNNNWGKSEEDYK